MKSKIHTNGLMYPNNRVAALIKKYCVSKNHTIFHIKFYTKKFGKFYFSKNEGDAFNRNLISYDKFIQMK